MSDRSRIVVQTAFLLIWTAFVSFVTVRHEPWRDEVRALSIAIEPSHFWEIPVQLHEEGHPIVWYLLLRAGWTLLGDPVVLKLLSVSIAAVAVYLVLFHSPFPLWQRILFACGTLPLYEYSVVSRNYGIAMLLVFLFAAFRRRFNPVASGIVLAILANTNAWVTVLTPLIATVWVLDEWRRDSAAVRRKAVPWIVSFGLIAVGAAYAIYCTTPEADTPFFDSSNISIGTLASSFVANLLRPGWTFSEILPLGTRWLVALLVIGLLPRIDLAAAALCSFVSMGMFSDLIYRSRLRHEGMVFVTLILLYWMAVEWTRGRELTGWSKRFSMMGRYFALTILLAFQVVSPRSAQYRTSFQRAWADVERSASSSALLGELVASRSDLSGAVVAGDPQVFLDSLPYYLDNPLYFPREHRYGTYTHHGAGVATSLTLGELLASARQLRSETGKPVVIVIGWSEFPKPTDRKETKIRSFTWTDASLEDFRASTRELAKYSGSLYKEDYQVYLLE